MSAWSCGHGPAFGEDQGDVVVLVCGIQAADFLGDGFERGLARFIATLAQPFD